MPFFTLNKDFRVLDYIGKCKLKILGLFLIVTVHSLIFFSLSLVFKIIYESSIETPEAGSLSYVFFLVILASVAGVSLFVVGNIVALNLKHKFRRIIRQKLLDKLIHARYKSFINISGGELVNILIPETDTTSEALLNICKSWIYGIQIIIFLIMISFLNLAITAIFACVILINLALMNLAKKRIASINNELSGIRDRNFNFFHSYMQSIKEIKCYNLLEFQNEIYRTIAKDEKRKNLQLTRKRNLLKLFSELPIVLCMLILYAWGFYQLRADLISFGFLLSYIGLIGRFGFLVSNLSSSLSFLQHSKTAFRKVQELLSIKCETRQGEVIHDTISHIDISNLSFSYNRKTRIIKTLDISFLKNSFISIVGESGSGKSTIVNLILRLFHVKDGSIALDSKDINRINPDSIREHIGLVSQSGIILNDTLRNNIDLKKLLSDSEVLEICQDVGLGELLEKLSDGIHSEISVQGKNLSGGENQRILIARCLAKATNICILDEATSALDFKSERKIIEMIVRLKEKNPDFTIIAITHRPSFSKYSDIIYALRNGRIAEVGTHDELIQNDSYYASLFSVE